MPVEWIARLKHSLFTDPDIFYCCGRHEFIVFKFFLLQIKHIRLSNMSLDVCRTAGLPYALLALIEEYYGLPDGWFLFKILIHGRLRGRIWIFYHEKCNVGMH